MPLTVRRFVILTAALAFVAAAFGVAAPARAQEVERFSNEVTASRGGWVDTEITLAQGETAAIAAFGRASWDAGETFSGPEGAVVELCAPLAPEHTIGTLLARVGGGAAIRAAGQTVTGPGRLALAYNDCPDQYFDNAGTYSVTITVTRVPAPVITPAPQPEPVAAPSAEPETGGGVPWVLLVALVALLGVGAAGYVLMRRIAAAVPRFDPSARLESSAWLAPVRLRDLQNGRFPKKTLTVGGPDADIDFGVPGIRARLIPTAGGSARLETAGGAERVLVDGAPVIIGQRLSTGQRVKIGVREFVYLEERDARGRFAPVNVSVLDKPDPRAVA